MQIYPCMHQDEFTLVSHFKLLPKKRPNLIHRSVLEAPSALAWQAPKPNRLSPIATVRPCPHKPLCCRSRSLGNCPRQGARRRNGFEARRSKRHSVGRPWRPPRGFVSRFHENIRLSPYLANPLSKSQHQWADSDGCVAI